MYEDEKAQVAMNESLLSNNEDQILVEAGASSIEVDAKQN